MLTGVFASGELGLEIGHFGENLISPVNVGKQCRESARLRELLAKMMKGIWENGGVRSHERGSLR